MTMTAPAANTSAITSGLCRKRMKGLQTETRLPKNREALKMAPNGPNWLQIGSGSGDLFNDEGFLVGLDRPLTKRIQTGSRLQKEKN